MQGRIIMHLDMNSYFASVEQQANPLLRGKPVGVCAYLSANGTIIASSTEAKLRGVRTGCKVQEALRLIPEIVLVENEPAKYRCTTEKIFNILGQYTDSMEPYSIDEAFLDLTGWVGSFYQAERLAYEIRERISKEVGEWLKCSIGISWTKFLAKFAGDTAPKGSVLIINPDNLDYHLDKDLTEAWGIGKAMANRLKGLGINNLLALKRYDPQKIRHHLGIYGYNLWANANGEEVSRVYQKEMPKSIGHSYCLPQKSNDKDYLLKVLFKLCEKTGRRLRTLGLEAKTINVYLGFLYGGHLNKTFKVIDKAFTTREIFDPIHGFMNSTESMMRVNKLAVSVSNLAIVSSQLSLFDNRIKLKNLSSALDKLNDKFGEYTVINGLMFGTDEMAKDRVGFRKTLIIEK